MVSWRAPWTATPRDPCSSAARLPSSVVSQLPSRPLVTMFARRRTRDRRKRIARARPSPIAAGLGAQALGRTANWGTQISNDGGVGPAPEGRGVGAKVVQAGPASTHASDLGFELDCSDALAHPHISSYAPPMPESGSGVRRPISSRRLSLLASIGTTT